ncbi:class II lanthipeptide, LchA2/BrtA2 family [Vagococcus fluvialis]|uniref:class II lanthipeptide, LchA2/BrtA2 family n=1 Tax=Vagococcus fluvialis TaxID=2738 RepID=UPI0020342405|nr:class II lanthipeptide, LchA2/BrtA2 family [Vagococcus fluvialis]MCM2139857.1 class II lanthipeptide, LchA2/BrtA2 family [Vagococcus fluvialis]URZ88906.1 vagococcin T vcnA2 peptide [Vagococcus fluvialis]
MRTSNDIKNKTGYVEESKLKEMIEEPDYSGGAWTTLPCIGGIIAATLNFDACPTSACTKSCNK